MAVIGEQAEVFLNRCADEGIEIHRIERKNETTLVCRIQTTDVRRIRRLLKETKCRARFFERNGFPFLLRDLNRRIGIVFGLFFFFAILLLLSNIVWRLDVNGADPRLEEEIRRLLKEEHLYAGSLEFLVPDPGRIESRLTAQLPKVTWIGVSKNGTSYQVDVVQKKYPKEQKASGPRNLVAAKQAVVQRWIVENGQVVVSSDQFVKRGQMLVLGRIGREDDPKFVSASGQVIGETWYRSETSVPLSGTYTVYTGEVDRSHRLEFMGLSLPLWGFASKSKTVDEEVTTKPIRFFLWELPVSYRQTVYREKKTIRRDLNEAEALVQARETSKTELLGRLPEGARIQSETVEEKRTEDGKLTISMRYVVHENIALPQPIDAEKERKKLKGKKESDNPDNS